MADPEQRKKLRMERIKMAGRLDAASTSGAGGKSLANLMEDPNQPDWAKHQMLKEIEQIRAQKKALIVN